VAPSPSPREPIRRIVQVSPRVNPVFDGLPTTIFTVMSALARKHDAINLGQGFPDADGPEPVRRAAAEAILSGPNQYPPSAGTEALRAAVAAHNRRFYGLDVDPESEIIVTSGATEALADCLFALLEPGDEAVLIEPAYDAYAPLVRAAGATPRFVPLHPPQWRFDEGSLRAAFTRRTKLVVLNSPMNPTGKVFDAAELSLLAGLLIEHDAFAVCDEVYEHLTFDGRGHVPLMTLPGMRERCVRIGSAGKTFSLTGWKIGYVTAPRRLASVIAKTHQFVTFTSAPALQHAVAVGLASPDGYFRELAAGMQASRDRLVGGLREAGFSVLPCHGTYFVNADFSALDTHRDDMAFCVNLAQAAGVAAIPVSAFYDPGSRDVPRNLARFCFCKDDRSLDEAVQRLKRYFA
jgi:aspartate/methionine/tyrosine aminotransferase